MNRKRTQHDVRIRLTMLVVLVAIGLGTAACQNGFMVLDFEGEAGTTAGADGQDGTGDMDSLVDPPEGCVPDDRFYLREVWAPAVQNTCYGCHNPQGEASTTDFVLYNRGWGNYLEINRTMMGELAKTKRDGESVLLLKPLGAVSHGGGKVIDEGSDTYNRLAAFVDRVENPSNCQAANDENFYRDVEFLDDEQTMRKATLSLAGRLPTQQELQGGDLDEVLDDVMEEEAFYTRLRESFNDMLLTDAYLSGDDALDLLDEDLYPNARYYEDIGNDDDRRRERNRANDAVAREPLALIEHIVRNDRPFTQVITGDYTVVNPYSAQVYGVGDQVNFNDSSDPAEWREAQLPGVPHAGVLTSVPFLNRYPTTDTNRNRHRSYIFYKYFMATDVLKLAERPIDPAEADLTNNPTLFNEQCTVCHFVVDPVAGAFQNWDEEGRYSPPDDGWYTDMVPPGLEENQIKGEENLESLTWLAENAAADPRFVQSSIEHVYRMLTGEDPLRLPTDATRSDYDAAFRAYEVQYEFFQQIGEKFAAENYNLKVLIKEIVKSEYYKAKNARSVTPKRQLELADLGTARLLTPEQLHRKVVATTGVAWRDDDRDILLDSREFYLLYGGIDSSTITDRMEDPSALASAIAKRMSNDVSCLATADDFDRPVEDRYLFPHVSMADTPDANASAIRDNIKHLHWQLLGERVEDGDEELEATYNLFADVWQDGQSGDYGDGLPGRCRADGIDDDPNYTVRAWMAVISYLLSTYDFLYE